MRILPSLLFFLLTTALQAQPSEESRFVEMVREASRDAAAALHSGSASVRVLPEDAHPLVRQVLAEEVSRTGARVTEPSQAEAQIVMDLREMKLYTVSLGNSSYLRRCVFQAGVLVTGRSRDAISWSRSVSAERLDTLDTAPENRERDFRTLSSSTWIDDVLVPLLAATAAVLTVVLLFTVRGS